MLSLPKEIVREKLLAFLKEDVGQADITSQLVVERDALAEAEIVAKDRGVAAGLDEAQILLEVMNLECRPLLTDGDKFEKNAILMHIKGNARDLLTVERTLLNIVTRMSGIATKTRLLQEAAMTVNPSVKVASTRKVPPGSLYFDKRAVALGGGDTHRLHLDDLILIKDNHKALVGGIREAVRRAKAGSFSKKIEVEVSTADEAVEAAEAGADIVMFDNMTPSSIRDAVKSLESKGVRKRLVLEASGGIDEKNILEFARSGVDMLSLGSLTHSARALDLSLELKGLKRR